MAAATTSLLQLGRADASVRRADPLVEGGEVVTDPADNSLTPTGHAIALGRVLPHGRVPVGYGGLQPGRQVVPQGLQGGDVLAQGLGPLHHLELDVLELGLPSSERGELVLERLEVLGRPGAGLEPGAVAGGAVPHQLHVGLGLVHLTLHVGQRRPRVDQLGVDRARLVLQRSDLAVLRQVRGRVRDLVEPGVDGLQVEQRELAGRVGFQQEPPGVCGVGGLVVIDGAAALAPTTNVHGSVRNRET